MKKTVEEETRAVTVPLPRSVSELDPGQRDVMNNWVAPDLNDRERNAFMAYCVAIGADPVGREIYVWKQPDGKIITFPGVDWLRSRAADTGEYEGQTSFEYFDGTTWHPIWLGDKPPVAVRVGVWRKNFREPLYGVSIYKRDSKGRSMRGKWGSDPVAMMEVRAEYRALKRGYPRETANSARHLRALAGEYGIDVEEPDFGPPPAREAIDVSSEPADVSAAVEVEPEPEPRELDPEDVPAVFRDDNPPADAPDLPFEPEGEQPAPVEAEVVTPEPAAPEPQPEAPAPARRPDNLRKVQGHIVAVDANGIDLAKADGTNVRYYRHETTAGIWPDRDALTHKAILVVSGPDQVGRHWCEQVGAIEGTIPGGETQRRFSA